MSVPVPDTRVVVVGGGVAGLVVAAECCRPGFSVTLLEAGAQTGGSVAPVECAGLLLDAGAESFATRGGHVQSLIEECGLGDDIVTPNPAGAWVRAGRRSFPLPKAGLLGIPSSPLAHDVVTAIGWRAALRAYGDRLMPVLTIGSEKRLGALVRKRMGSAVLDRLVAPVVSGIYSANPDDLDLDVIAPGLNAALTRTGSLSGAVGQLRGPSKAGSAVLGIRGGMWRLPVALSAHIIEQCGQIDTGARVTTLESWPDDPDEITSPRWSVRVDDGRVVPADVVVCALPDREALAFLAGSDPSLAALSALDWPESSSVDLVTLVVSQPDLTTNPRGTGVLVSDTGDSGVVAKALTHSSAKWSWVAQYAGEGRQIIRLSYGRAGRVPETRGMSERDRCALVVRDASALLGTPIDESAVLDIVRTSWTNTLPFAARGQRERIDHVRSSVAAIPGLEVTGSWLAGTGLASVVPDARRVAKAVRGLRWKSLIEETKG